MARRRAQGRSQGRGHSTTPRQPARQPDGQLELIVITRPGAGLRATPSGFRSETGASIPSLTTILGTSGVSVRPLFGANEERIRDRTATLTDQHELPDLATFYHVDAPQEQLHGFAEQLRALDEVEAAYVKPHGEPPVAATAVEQLNDMAPREDEPPSQTPDFTGRQGYLDAAPGGINARFAWQRRGGRGAGVRIIDCEWAWRFTHEDLHQNKGGVIIGAAGGDDNHGTAVLGEFAGDRNTFGVTGICSDAFVMGASFATLPTATVIHQAADRLRAGDILLLEIHRAGPGASGAGQDGYIAIEWWPDDLAAIRYAVARGVVVVEAAGNGARDLDAAIYNQPAPGFPASWRNPFNPANPGSGAVLVGAGAPPPGTHGRDHGPDRSRLDFSNYGRRLDVQGWGREVTSTGYGDLQGGPNPDLWYTDQFSGTSSASPIVVGALGCIQGILRARGRAPLNPAAARTLLRSTGSPQQDAPGRPRSQRIGNRPDLRQMVRHAVGLAPAETVDGPEVDRAVAMPNGGVVINIGSHGVTINIGTDTTADMATEEQDRLANV